MMTFAAISFALYLQAEDKSVRAYELCVEASKHSSNSNFTRAIALQDEALKLLDKKGSKEEQGTYAMCGYQSAQARLRAGRIDDAVKLFKETSTTIVGLVDTATPESIISQLRTAALNALLFGRIDAAAQILELSNTVAQTNKEEGKLWHGLAYLRALRIAEGKTKDADKVRTALVAEGKRLAHTDDRTDVSTCAMFSDMVEKMLQLEEDAKQYGPGVDIDKNAERILKAGAAWLEKSPMKPMQRRDCLSDITRAAGDALPFEKTVVFAQNLIAYDEKVKAPLDAVLQDHTTMIVFFVLGGKCAAVKPWEDKARALIPSPLPQDKRTRYQVAAIEETLQTCAAKDWAEAPSPDKLVAMRDKLTYAKLLFGESAGEKDNSNIRYASSLIKLAGVQMALVDDSGFDAVNGELNDVASKMPKDQIDAAIGSSRSFTQYFREATKSYPEQRAKREKGKTKAPPPGR